MITTLSNEELKEINGGGLNDVTEGLLYGIGRTARFGVRAFGLMVLTAYLSI
ncbi:bacteriocin [uncultured Bacteroides sp.]|uniref:bacteriocin n=1 Tax=uncultured Bacteroides sp. TaxID=162156 RepID=UPI0025D3BACE|nr:bacteriocin [uncultured Bacteroides sp.]